MLRVTNDQAFADFNAQIEKAKKLPEIEGRRRRNRVAENTIELLVMNTPVKKGVARGGWGVGAGKGAVTVVKTGKRGKGLRDRSGRKTIASGKAVIRAAKWDDNIVFENHVPYINKLDNGYSRTQAPLGIIAPAVISLRIRFFG